MERRENLGRAVRRVLWIELTLNIVVALTKGIYGYASGSLAISGDAIHSAVDAGANIMGLLIVTWASRPADNSHPYGHSKFEALAALGLGVLIGASAIRFGWRATQGLVSGHSELTTDVTGFLVLLGTMAINIFIAIYERRKGKQLQSSYLIADAAHTASDVFVTLFVLASFTASHYGISWADPLGGVLVMLVVVWVGIRVVWENISSLSDHAVLPSEDVVSIANSVPGVSGAHRVRSRGQTHFWLDLHVLIDGDTPLTKAHELAHQVEDRIRARWPQVIDVVVHLEPSDDPPEPLSG